MYDELKDINKAISGDAAARVRVEVLTPWIKLLKDELGKVYKLKEEDQLEAYCKLMDNAIATVASMLLIQIQGPPEEAIEAMPLLMEKLKDRYLVLATGVLLQRGES